MRKTIKILIASTITAVMIAGCGNKDSINEDKVLPNDSLVEDKEQTEEQAEQEEIEIEQVEKSTEEILKDVRNLIDTYEVNDCSQLVETSEFGVTEINVVKDYGKQYKFIENDEVVVEAYVDYLDDCTYIRSEDEYYRLTNEELTDEQEESLTDTPQTMERYFTKDELDENLRCIAISYLDSLLDTIEVNSIEVLEAKEDDSKIEIKVSDSTAEYVLYNIEFNKYNITHIDVQYGNSENKIETNITYEYNILDTLNIPEDIKGNAITVNSVSCFVLR